MLRILVVEDEQQKKQLIAGAICRDGRIGLDNLTFADNVRDAKRLLTQLHFDLVVLDINIPRTADTAPEVGAGLDVLRFVRSNLQSIPPRYVFGLTAYEDGFASAADDFTSALWKLGRFSYSEESWKRSLGSAIDFLVHHQGPPYATDGRTYHIDVGIVAALDEELEALLKSSKKWERISVAHDHAPYHSCILDLGEEQTVTVVATVAPRMGLPTMAIAATKLITAFHPRVLATTGICAGVREKTAIGDILVADPCFDWGSGKWARDKQSGQLKFLPAQYQWRLDAKIAAAVRELSTNQALLRDIHESYDGTKPPVVPRVLIDAVASGASVLQVEEMMSGVRAQHKNLIGVEMEAYSLFTAAEYSSEPRPLCVAVKSVCDFGDEPKNDEFHPYASHTSSRFLLELLRHKNVCPVDGSRSG